ncbi:MAG TPA: tetratricopeptide repeat protein [Gaiellaceae bacterium]|nr:tetratricopeptide repeat protein [Gaiellaceae bacterium]
MKRLLLAGAVAAIAATALLAGGTLRREDGASAAPSSRQLVRLGFRELDAARRTGEPGHYTRSEQALRRALDAEPNDAEALIGLASLANSRHHFREGLALARRVQGLSPDTALVYGVIGDSLIELGRYDEAFRNFERLGAVKPGLTAYSRISYARELLGYTDGAIAAMQLAVDSAGDAGEPSAWARTQLGKLYFSKGRTAEAERQYRLALGSYPEYVHALDALAHVEAARGRFAHAISLERRAVKQTPLPQFVGALGDLYRSSGRPAAARAQFRLVGVLDRLFVANGVATDLELALFNVDHGVRIRESLDRARRAQRERPSIEADDVLAWALARNGQCGQGLRFSTRALRLGTRDAPKFFHRGMIERCLGHELEAKRWFRRALRTNPNFSLVWAPVARKALS